MTAGSDLGVVETKHIPPKRRGKACITCKIRRIKCTYERPSCQRCLGTGRKCDGYPAQNQQDPAPVAFLIALDYPVPSQCDHEALTAFQFFNEVCAPALLNYGSQYFWNQLVLQACYMDESIKHLTIAASRLGSNRLMRSKDATLSDDGVFLSHYGRALRLLGRSHNPDPVFLLIACLLLILCDEFQDNSFAALQHLIAGRRILATYQSADAARRRNTAIEELGPIFAKLELQTGEVYSQVKPTSDHWALHNTRKTWLRGDIQHFAKSPDTGVTWESAEGAAQALQDIAFECTSHLLSGCPPHTRFHTVPNLTAHLNAWLDAYTAYETTVYTHPTPITVTEFHLLRTYHLCLHVLSRCAPFNQELAFDSYASNLEHVIVSCGFLVRAAAKARLIPVLFFVATRYRDASFRRRAVEMLRLCGVDGTILAKIALKVVRIEERGVSEAIVCSDIPEEHRIRLVDVLFAADSASYILRFKRRPIW